MRAAVSRALPTHRPLQAAIDVFKPSRRTSTAKKPCPDTRANLEAIRQFLADREILTVPSQVRRGWRRLRNSNRATSFASMDTRDRSDEGAEAYYYVDPGGPEWPGGATGGNG